MKICNYVRNVRYGVLPHNPFSSVASKAADRGINVVTLARISRGLLDQEKADNRLRHLVELNLREKLEEGFDPSALEDFDRGTLIAALGSMGTDSLAVSGMPQNYINGIRQFISYCLEEELEVLSKSGSFLVRTAVCNAPKASNGQLLRLLNEGFSSVSHRIDFEKLTSAERQILADLPDISISRLIEDRRNDENAMFEIVMASSRESVNAYWKLCEKRNPFPYSIFELVRMSSKGDRDFIAEMPFDSQDLIWMSGSRCLGVLLEIARNIHTPESAKTGILSAHPEINDNLLGKAPLYRV